MQHQVLQGYRLSPQQKRLWSLQQSYGAGPFHAQCVLLLEGPLDLKALAAALEDAASRHHILRTTFHCFYGMTIPVQVVAQPAVQIESLCDLRDLPRPQQEARLEKIAAAAQAPFDFERGPVMRASIASLSEGRHMLFLTMPALCADSTGLRNTVKEISRSYEAIAGGSEIDDEVTQYIVTSEWQNDLFESEDLEVGKSFWNRQRACNPGEPVFPFGKHPSAGDGFEPRCFRFTLGREKVAKLDAAARRLDTPRSLFLLACWHLLLGRMTGRTEIIIGAAYDGRTDEEMESGPGLFAKYLPIRSSLGGRIGMAALAGQIDRAARECHAWQDWFAWEYLEDVSPGEAESSSFPFCFEYEEEPDVFTASGVTFSIRESHACTDRFELKLRCNSAGQEVVAELHYNSAVFTAREAGLLAELYDKLTGSAVENPDAFVGELSLLSDEQRRQLVEEFNGPPSESTQDRCVHELFEEQVERSPDAVALVYEDESLTYAELNRRCNRLARLLRREGAGPESVVAICVERSLDMVVGLLGVLKSGAAYLPIDSTNPIERIAFVLKDARAEILLTEQKLAGGFTEPGVRKLLLDEGREALQRESDENFDSGAAARNIAYVIYTSGSTGKPKGVMIEHRSPVNLMAALDSAVYAGRHDPPWRVSLNAPIGFDASVQQLMLLTRGETLHIIPQRIRADGKSLVSYLATNRIHLFDCTPSQLEVLLAAGLLDEAGVDLRAVLVAGEAVDNRLWKRIAAASGPVFYNIYGPTECTVNATLCRVSQSSDKPTIGRPLGGYYLYLLDSPGQLVPVGVSAELHIGGVGLARGYLNLPHLTAEKFVPNCFSTESGARLYKTGDMGRHLPDGNIEFLGRADGQVKIRGYRIELEEIESVLAQHAGVRDVAVVARAGAAGDRLIAYVVPNDGGAELVTELGGYARGKLPDYMVPSVFLKIDTMPLTASGKKDRRALPAPESIKQGVAQESSPPQTIIEEIVAGTWEDLLGLERVGREDNFFSLGGHSLLATDAITRLRDIFHVDLPLVSLFESPTVAGLAERVEAATRMGNGSMMRAIRPVPRSATVPLSYEQQRMWMLEQQMPEGSGAYVSGLWRVEGPQNVPALEQAVADIVRRHEILRTIFPAPGGEPVQVVVKAGPAGLPCVNLSALAEFEQKRELDRLSRSDMSRPFELDQTPPLRTTLVYVGAGTRFLQYTMHHIIADAVSMVIVEREMADLCGHYAEGLASPLEELPFQYADYSAWQREYMTGDMLERNLDYWRVRLEGLPTLELPTSGPRPSTPTYRGAWERLLLSRTITNSLQALSAREGATLFMTLLAVLQAILCRYTGQEDVCVGSPVTFRNRMQIDRLIGYFTNILVLRAEITDNPTFLDLLKQVRDKTLEAYIHQDLPFELLVEDLGPEYPTASTPLFQVWFNFPKVKQPQPSGEADEFVTGLLGTGGQENNWAPYDLTVLVTETGPGLHVAMEYHKDLFDPSTIRNMLGDFETLVRSIVADPEQRILDIPLPAGAKSAYSGMKMRR